MRQPSCPVKSSDEDKEFFTLDEMVAMKWKWEAAWASYAPWARAIENTVHDYIFENFPSLVYHGPSPEHNLYHSRQKGQTCARGRRAAAGSTVRTHAAPDPPASSRAALV